MKTWYSLLAGLFLSSSLALPVKAQITIDGTTNTNLTPIDTGIRIDDGDRAGANLFHSFEQFSVLNGSEAFFNNANDIVNIFSRVTGGNISTIDGLLRANGTANLFLLNPAGIIFGENAQLDIGGSFLSSTADSIVFSDGVKFLATDVDEPPLLTINMPIGLNLGNNPGQIVNRSYNSNGLEVATGESITLVGGNINLERGKLFAPEGRVELGGLSAAGEVDINDDGSLVFPEGVARADVLLTNGAEVDVRGAGGGSIGVNARNLELSGGELGSSNLLAGIADNSGSPDAQAGDITINAEDTISVSQASLIANRVEESGAGNSGEIKITTTNLFLSGGSQVDASTLGDGNGGAITIEASGTISAEGEDSGGFSSGIVSNVSPTGKGNSGGIDITTNNLSLSGGGRLDANTFGVGDAGQITITAEDTITARGENSRGFSSRIASTVVGEGDSEGIDITTNNLSLFDGSVVNASTFGEGNAGKITISASGTISADGEDRDGFNSGIFSQVAELVRGTSGGININTTNLSLQDGGAVAASTFGEGNAGKITISASRTISAEGQDRDGFSSGIFSSVAPTGKGNSEGIDITTNNLSLKEGGVVGASTFGEGDAGKIIISASGTISADGESQAGSGIGSIVGETARGNANGIDITTTDLSLTNNAQISVQSFGGGNAGDLSIQANSIALENGSSLLASTPVKIGGSITLDIAEILTLRDNSTISARAFNNANGGNININSDLIIAFPNQNNDIIANAEEGNGGNIEITTRGIFGIEERPLNSFTNDINASSEFGLDGTININLLDTNPAEGLEESPRTVIDPDKLVVFSLCSLARDSEFYFTAKGGNTPDPVEIIDEGVIAVDLVEPAPFESEEEVEAFHETPLQGTENVEREIVEAQGWIFHENGVIELVAYKTDPNGAPAQPKDPRVCPK